MSGEPRDWPAAVVAAGVAILVVAGGIGNGFAYDDVALLVQDPRLHSFATIPSRLAEPYWPSGLFRPVTLAVMGTEWVAGGGAAPVFRIVSTLLYALVSVAALLLVRRAGAPRWATLLGAIAFAVHPVHSEVTANVVGQAELLSALFAVAAVWWYVSARQQAGLGWRDSLVVIVLFLLAANAKESGYVVPGLLVAAELSVVREARPWRQRLAALRTPALLLLAVMLGSLAVRSQVLGGVGGETPHSALEGLSLLERAVAMLAVVPEWTRLLLWPAHLQAEYGPPGLVPRTAPGMAHLPGLFILIGCGWAIIRGWRRAPLVSFGLAWVVISLAPVTNVVFPTGILLAERTLFLPSVGLALAIAGAATLLPARWAAQPGLRRAATGIVGAVLVVAAVRSAIRQPLWRDSLTILRQTVQDAPRSYRAQLVLGKALLYDGDRPGAEAAFRAAAALWERDPRPFEELGQLLRARGACGEAIPVLRAGVLADSTSDTARSRLVECLIVERQWDEAEREIGRGVAQGVTGYGGALRRVQDGRAATP